MSVIILFEFIFTDSLLALQVVLDLAFILCSTKLFNAQLG